MSDFINGLDFDALSDNDECTLDFNELDKAYPIGQEEQNSTFDTDFSLLPNATTAAPAEP